MLVSNFSVASSSGSAPPARSGDRAIDQTCIHSHMHVCVCVCVRACVHVASKNGITMHIWLNLLYLEVIHFCGTWHGQRFTSAQHLQRTRKHKRKRNGPRPTHGPFHSRHSCHSHIQWRCHSYTALGPSAAYPTAKSKCKANVKQM